MLDNNTYNLMMQIIQEHKSLWRIKDDYTKDANDSSRAFWEKMVADKEGHIKELTDLLKAELNK